MNRNLASVFGRRVQAYIHDVLMTGLAFMLAVELVVGPGAVADAGTFYWKAGLAVLLGSAAFLLKLGLYQGMWRFASSPDLVRVVRASSLLALSLFAGSQLAGLSDRLPASVAAVFWLAHIVLLGGARFIYRMAKDRKFFPPSTMASCEQTAVLICGTDHSAANFIRANQARQQQAYSVAGILDRGSREKGRSLLGVPVLGSIHELPEVMTRLAGQNVVPETLALSPSWADGNELPLADILALAERSGLPVARLPDPTRLDIGATPSDQLKLKPIPVEALLGRPQTTLDRAAIVSLAKGRCVLVTGAGGTIGGELTRQLAALSPRKLVMLENGEFNLYRIDHEIRNAAPDLEVETILCDVRDRDAVFRVFKRVRPELVLHAAALKHVPLVEANPSEGVLTNVVGTRNVADACRAVGVRTMVMISTDKAIRPTNVMGATKRVAELYCQAVDLLGANAAAEGTRYVAVRFGNVLGSSGSVVPLFERQLQAGGPLTVTHPDMQRYFMTVPEAVELVLQAAAYGTARTEDRGRIFVLDMGKPMRIVDLARQMIRLAGLRPDVDVQIQFTGLRPGEKLFEEIFDPEEMPTKTEADGVFIASPRVMDPQLLARALDELETAAASNDTARIRVILGNLVPGFENGTPAQAARLKDQVGAD
ncbi:polysaccharide biosynthesis protein [Indioceanicola profundi]|uniref:polysaccharide biosynthesis protein n=1 Tax=Indioceanicola profundi TaxID=2220096 RepID=UPI000E6AA696|nr:nucleoside-diphosphate sugar epimerase/dehydratase [Indioceanicola profundi]